MCTRFTVCQLRVVKLSSNSFEAFPEALCLLVSMKSLDLSRNRLAQVNEKIFAELMTSDRELEASCQGSK